MKATPILKSKIGSLKELQLVEERLAESASSSMGQVTKNLSHHLLKRGGKRLRPLLVVLSASFGPYSQEALLDTAVAAELIHTASLIHDDIIDESGERRGKQSINKMWGNKWAVLTGDHLFARAFSLLTKHASLGVLEPMTKAISLMCEGEIEQLERSKEREIPDEIIYIDYINKKTASFLAACCLAGARVCSLGKQETLALENYGLHLGLAFQIIDDVFDLLPIDNKKLGKPIGSDLRQGIITLPLLYLLKDPAHDIMVGTLLSKNKIEENEIDGLSRIAYASGAIEKARQKAAEHVSLAKENLFILKDTPSRYTLSTIADYVLERQS